MTNGALSVLRIVIAVVVVSGFGDAALAQAQRTPPREPMMTEELMGRLIQYARGLKGTGSLDARICKVLDLCDGIRPMPLRLAISDATDGIHSFGIPPEVNSGDFLIMVKHDTVVATYLTDKTARLRAAAILENGVARLVTNEKAAAKFKAELALFAKEAAELPPTR